jgi:hypothetical protein
MRLPPTRVLLSRLARAERATYGRATLLASRFELASSGVILLQLVCDTRARLDELEAFAEQREFELLGLGPRMSAWAGAVVDWLAGMWPGPAIAVYGSLASATLRHVAIAAQLRLAALRERDHRLADWCALWMAQRVRLADRLTLSLSVGDLGAGDAHRFARLSIDPLEVRHGN